jgi:hypothetical protein
LRDHGGRRRKNDEMMMRDLSAIRDERRKREKASEKSYLFSLRSNLKIFLAKKISKEEEANFFLRAFLV